jgi:NAD(P)-dependent dehydrogenase (short-subunit alcohol dehydrogenase family)
MNYSKGVSDRRLPDGRLHAPHAARTADQHREHRRAVRHDSRPPALKRRLTPDDTAAAVAYLASDAAAPAMTGQVLCADGGLIMR